MAAVGQRTLLLVDDEPAQRRLVTALAARAGWRTVTAADGGEALSLLEAGDTFDAVLIDVWRPAESGAALVGAIRKRAASLPIVMLTAQASVGLAVEAMRAGASDFLLKPVAPERLMAALGAAADPAEEEGELRPLTERDGAALAFDEIVGSAPAFRAALAVAAKTTRGRGSVVIEGEAGTGKVLVARAIHAASSRARRTATLVDCAALPPGHAEPELFGYERDAFPGAFAAQPGRVLLADGSTLILDDPGALPADAQAGLVMLLEQGMVRALGGRGPRAVDVRLIALTERPLAQIVGEGRMRPDLACLLGGTTIRLPALRERTGDVPALARHLLGRIGRMAGFRRLGLTDEALALLAAFPWPGNVRQLHDALFRAAVDAIGDVLTPADFPHVARASGGAAAGAGVALEAAGIHLYGPDGHLRPLEDIEGDIIRLAIGHYQGRMSEVARRLGIGRSTLYRKLTDLGLDSAA